MVRTLLFALVSCAAAPAAPLFQQESPSTEAPYWTVERLPQPVDAVLEVGGMHVMDSGRVVVCTRRGEVWWLDGAFGEDAAEAKFKKAAEGLQEPLGMLWHEGALYAATRGELVRMYDSDGDDWFDVFETVTSEWPISGNYHEYNFGPRLAGDGTLWLTTNKPFGGEPFGKADWRGFAFEVTTDGVATPRVCGLRSPAGIQNAPWGEVFYTDNQGEWCGASKLALLEPGSFQGHPHGLDSTADERWPYEPLAKKDVPNRVKMPEVLDEIDTFRLPTVWFPYDEMGRSPSGFAWDPSGGKFGPYAGQIFVGDQYAASVMRVDLEKVDGVWQGACFPFRSGLPCGVIRVAFGPDGTLLAGMSDRGWTSRGADSDGVARLRWTGEMPFEIRRMLATKDGFRLEFTRPADAKTLADTATYSFDSYTYLLHEDYGSPEVDVAQPTVTAVRAADDGMSVELVVDGLRLGYVHELRAPALRSAASADEGLLHPRAYYTLVRQPK